MSNHSLIVRSCGERTTSATVEILSAHYGSERVRLVSGAPFETTLAEGYRQAIETGHPLTVTVDADVMPSIERIDNLVTDFDTTEDTVIGASALTLDRFFCGSRYVGVRIFRTKYLDSLISEIPTPGSQIRPETFAHRQLEKQGLRFIKSDVVTGLHGYEQYNADILRTIFVVGRKFQGGTGELLNLWSRLAEQHSDFAMSLMAISASIQSTLPGAVDQNLLGSVDLLSNLLSSLGILEKPPLAETPQALTDFVNREIDQHVTPREYEALKHLLFYIPPKPTLVESTVGLARSFATSIRQQFAN